MRFFNWLLSWLAIPEPTQGHTTGEIEKKDYRVVWSRPKPKKEEGEKQELELEAGTFSAPNNVEAQKRFEEDYKNNPKYGGDTLRLLRIKQREEVEEIVKIIGKEVKED